MSRRLLAQADEVARAVEDLSARLTEEYVKFCGTVKANGLARSSRQPWQTTFEIPRNPVYADWRPDTTDTRDLTMVDGDDLYFLPRAYLEDPDAWLQGALAAHGQLVADQSRTTAQKRAARKAELRRQLEALEAEE